jgi:hypothetical protein
LRLALPGKACQWAGLGIWATFYIFCFCGKARHSTRVPLFVIEHLSHRTGANLRISKIRSSGLSFEFHISVFPLGTSTDFAFLILEFRIFILSFFQSAKTDAGLAFRAGLFTSHESPVTFFLMAA